MSQLITIKPRQDVIEIIKNIKFQNDLKKNDIEILVVSQIDTDNHLLKIIRVGGEIIKIIVIDEELVSPVFKDSVKLSGHKYRKVEAEVCSWCGVNSSCDCYNRRNDCETLKVIIDVEEELDDILDTDYWIDESIAQLRVGQILIQDLQENKKAISEYVTVCDACGEQQRRRRINTIHYI